MMGYGKYQLLMSHADFMFYIAINEKHKTVELMSFCVLKVKVKTSCSVVNQKKKATDIAWSEI
jgi:hypothetical protein